MKQLFERKMVMNKAIEKINKFLKATTKTFELRFDDGMFLQLKKHVKNGKHFLEVHTSGYDGTFKITESLEWINWTLYDYSANGFLRNF